MNKKATRETFYATGRRKRSIAKLYLTPGSGKMDVNGKPLNEYFGGATLWSQHALAPIRLLKQQGLFDLKIFVCGGGMSGQAGAVSLALARVMDAFSQKHAPKVELTEDSDESDSGTEGGLLGTEKWRSQLKKEGLLTRDSRVVLRKKVGLVKARKAKQFSKR